MKKTLQELNNLIKNNLIADYAIGGGIAALFYIEPFLTYDLDVFIILSIKERDENLILLTPIYDYLKQRGYSWKEGHIIVEGIPVQFIPADELEEEAVRNAREVEYEKVITKIISPEYLISILLKVGRKKDTEKIERLLSQTEIDNEKLEDILYRYGLQDKFNFYNSHGK